MAAQCITVLRNYFYVSTIHILFYAYHNNLHVYALCECKVEENSGFDLAFRKDCRLNFVEAHSCLQANQFAISGYMRIDLKSSQNT